MPQYLAFFFQNILIRVRRCSVGRRPAVYSGVVADFGLATALPKTCDERRLPQVGSPYWMSPECLRGLYYDGKADVFSFGIVLCELIALIDADPDLLPRTENFGVDYIAFTDLVGEMCPTEFLQTAFSCVQVAHFSLVLNNFTSVSMTRGQGLLELLLLFL